MHPNPAFRPDNEAPAWDLVRTRGFGILTVMGPERIMASHIPFVVEGAQICAHLVRSNPIARMLAEGPADALLIVSGPDAYVSPDWYGMDDQVPTWNYVAVHLRGRLALMPEDTLLGHLEALSATHEAHLAPKPPWTHHKMSEGVMARMMRQIMPVSLEVASLEQTWKLNQNKDADARLAAADAIEAAPSGHDQPALAALMRNVGN